MNSDVINLSFSGSIPLGLGWTAAPVEVVTAGYAIAGVAVFAAAGNTDAAGSDDADVDAEDCFIFCVEEQLIFPCELSGVTCVGGIDAPSTDRDPGSWYGHEDVDLWAPFEVYIGPRTALGSPPIITDQVRRLDGTSFATPYAAATYLLVKAAAPSASRGAILAHMQRTAIDGTARARDIVQPYEAVIRALGGNDPFEFDWTEPRDGQTVGAGLVPLVADVTDPLDDDSVDPFIEWFVNGARSGINSPSTLTTEFDLRPGANTIELQITDGPYRYNETRTITLVNTPPELAIDNPAAGQTFAESQTITLTVRSSDIDQFPRQLPDSAITWRVGADVIGTGHQDSVLAGTLGVGAHTVTVSGSDGTATTTKSVDIIVQADPADVPPSPQIIQPTAEGIDVCCSDAMGQYAEVDLQGSANDPEDGALTGDALVWTTTADENGDGTMTTRELGTGTTVSDARLYGAFRTHVLTLTATDSGGQSASVIKQIEVVGIE